MKDSGDASIAPIAMDTARPAGHAVGMKSGIPNNSGLIRLRRKVPWLCFKKKATVADRF